MITGDGRPMEGHTDSIGKDVDHFVKTCRERGLKVTHQRMAIFEELTRSGEHPSAMMVHKRVSSLYPTISLDTVNRTLLTFQELGLARVIGLSGEAKRFDGNKRPHHHFKCTRCGQLIDIYGEFQDLTIPEELSKRHTIHDISVIMQGICEGCKE